MTTVTSDGSETVEETEARPLASQSEDMRVVKRSVTTVRRSGTDADAIERREFELDVNGRFVPVRTETARRAGK